MTGHAISFLSRKSTYLLQLRQPTVSLISYRIKPQKAGTKNTILSSNLNHKLRSVIESTPRLQNMNGALALAFGLVYGGH